jgi:hypothetical protein
MTIHIAVVGHVSRQSRAEALAASLNAELFLDRLTLGATFGHLNALNWGAQFDGHLIILEDDAQPVEGFLDLATQWIDSHSQDLTSFYLGTGRPPGHQPRIHAALDLADVTKTDHIALPNLIHAVAYSIPCQTIPALKLSLATVADFGLGRAWHSHTKRPVLYSIPSYVDHADTDSIVRPRANTPPRKAWRLP